MMLVDLGSLLASMGCLAFVLTAEEAVIHPDMPASVRRHASAERRTRAVLWVLAGLAVWAFAQAMLHGMAPFHPLTFVASALLSACWAVLLAFVRPLYRLSEAR